MLFRKIRSFIKFALLLFLFAGSVIILLNTLIQTPYIQKEILKRISNAIGYDIKANDIEIIFRKGIGISINELSAISRKGNERFSSSSVRVALDPKDLLAGQITPVSFYLSSPVIELPWEERYDRQQNLKGFLPAKIPVFWFPGIQSLAIDRGYVTFIGASFHLDDFYLTANRVSSSPLTLMAISRGEIGFKEETTHFELNGKVMPVSGDNQTLLVDVRFKADRTPVSWVPLPRSIQFRKGYVDLRLNVHGDPVDSLSVKGLIDIDRIEFELIRKNRHKKFIIPEATLDLESMINGDNIKVSSLKIKGHDMSIDLGLSFYLMKDDGPFLDLNFKSEAMDVAAFKTFFPSPLLPQWVETRLFPILSGGKVKINDFSLKGGIDQIRHMSGHENRSIMETIIECRGFEVSGGGIQLPFQDVSAEIAYKDGTFSVSGLKGIFGDSIINDAGFNITDVFSPSRFYEISLDGDFDIEEFLGQKDMEVIPAGLSRRLDNRPEITGRIRGKAEIGYQKEWNLPRILKGEFLLNDLSLYKEELAFPLKFSEASAYIDNKDSDYMSGSGTWGNSSFNVSANFGIHNMIPYFKDGLLSADADMNQVLDLFRLKDKIPLAFSENLPWTLSLEKEGWNWRLKGNVSPGSAAIKSKALTIRSSGDDSDNISFEMGINPIDKRIDINNILVRLNDSFVNVTGAYDLQTRTLVELGVNSTGLSMKDLSVLSGNREIFSGGAIKGELDISMGDKGDGVMVTGPLEGNGLSFQAGMSYPRISDCSFQIYFSGKDAALNYSNMKAGETPFSIAGNIHGWKEIKGDLNIRSEHMDFSDILPAGDTLSNGNSKGILDDLNLGIQLDVSGGIWRELPYGQLNADLVLADGNLFINDSRVNLDNGELTVKGHILKDPGPELLFAGDIHLHGQPADELLKEIGIDNNSLKGNLTLNGSLSVKGERKEDLLSGLDGSVNVLITKGLIINPSIFIKVLDFLSIQKIFKQRPADLKEEGLYFESITADAVIEKGVIETENFVMRSPVLNAVAYGKVDIPGKNVDYILGAQPHGTIDTIISKIPILGYIITGENKSIVAYPFEVKGPFSDPNVTFVPFDTLEGGVAGIIKRIFLTPVRIIDKIDKTLNRNGGNKGPSE